MKYRIEAPNKSQLSVGCKLGSFTFNHDEVLDTPIVNDLAKIFPVFFIPVDEPKEMEINDDEPVVEVVEEKEAEVVADEPLVQTEEEVEETTEPKKRGRKPKAD